MSPARPACPTALALVLGAILSSPCAAGAPPAPVPAFVAEMADAAIARLHGFAPAKDRATAVALFGQEFLGGFQDPGMLCPGCSGLGYEGMLAGQRLRLAHPERHDEVMRGYGYALTEAEGTCVAGFEASRFTPKHDRALRPEESSDWNWWVSTIGPQFVGPPAPRLPGHHKALVWTCRLTGWLSPPGSYGHMNLYGRQFRVLRSEFIPAPDSAP